MSCNAPNPYGGFDPFGAVNRGGAFTGWGGGYGCSGLTAFTDRSYRLGYGVGPGRAIPNIVFSASDPRTRIALGSRFWKSIEATEAIEAYDDDDGDDRVAAVVAAAAASAVVVAVVLWRRKR